VDFHHLLPAGFAGAPVCKNFATSRLPFKIKCFPRNSPF
jgi:hypothetical protein